MTLHPSEAAFLSALAQARASWSKTAARGLDNPAATEAWSERTAAWEVLARQLKTTESQEAFKQVVAELLAGVVHSSLVILDGGSALAETTTLAIQDDSGHEFKTFLHEFWPGFVAAEGGVS
jgi:hypothetical protein